MLIIKRLFIAITAVSAGFLPYIVKKQLIYKVNKEVEEKVSDFAHKWSLPSTSEEGIKHNEIYNLFTKNPSKFSKEFLNSFEKLFLHEWTINNYESSYFKNNSSNIKKKFQELKKTGFKKSQNNISHSGKNETNWKISKSHAEEKEFFINSMFENLFLTNSSNGLSIDNDEIDTPLKKLIAEFQKSAINSWIDDEKPFYLVEKTWNYSSNKENVFEFPEFENQKNKRQLISEIESVADEKLFTNTDLQATKDGWYIYGLLKKNKDVSSNGTITNNTNTIIDENADLIKLFTAHPNDSKIKICCICWLNQNCTQNYVTVDSELNKISFFRHLKGVSAVYKPQTTVNFYKKIINALSEDRTKDEKNKSETSKQFFSYLKNNLPLIIAKYYSSTPSSNKLHKINGHSKELVDLISESANLQKISNQNKHYWELKLKMFESVAKYSNIEISSDQKDLGLISVLPMDTHISSSIQAQEINFKDATDKNVWLNNDANINELIIQNKYDSLYEIVKKYKTSIKSFLNTYDGFVNSKGQTAYKFNEYLIDSVLDSFFENNELVKKFVENSRMMQELNITDDESSLEQYWNSILAKLQKHLNDYSITKDDLKKISTETLKLNKYLQEPLVNRLIYGGYKADENGQIMIKAKNYWTIKNYFISSDGFDLVSENKTEEIYHLYTINWLLKNKINSNMHYLIPKNEYGVLMWMRDVNYENSNNPAQKETTNSIDNLKDLKTTAFKTNFNNDPIFNPIFNKAIAHTSDKHNLKDFINPLSAIAYKEDNKNQELHGFMGLQTSKYTDKNIPEYVKNIIFKKFELSNPATNKSYLNSQDINKTTILGSSYGITQDFQNVTVEKILNSINSINSKEELLKILQDNNKELYRNEILREIKENHQDTTISNLSIETIKSIIKKVLNDNYLQSFKRFSGALQNIESSENKNETYLLKENINDKKGKMVFIVQINYYDLLNNLSKLKEDIDTKTIIKTLMLTYKNNNLKQTIKSDVFSTNY